MSTSRKFSRQRYESPGDAALRWQVVCIISKDPSSFIFRVRQSKIAGLIDPEVIGTMTI